MVHTDRYHCDLPPGHRFNMGKFRGLYRKLLLDRVVHPAKQVRLCSSKWLWWQLLQTDSSAVMMP